MSEGLEPPTDNDRLLALYLGAPSDAEAAAPLSALFSLHAGPIIEEILQAKRRRTQRDDFELEDVGSTARAYLLRHLASLRAGEHEEPIRDFRAYVATVTYSAWAEALRARHPQRALLLNRLRYLLENRTTQRGFAIWGDPGGAQWCGFAHWSGRTGGATPKRQWLLADPGAAAREAYAGADPATLILPALVAKLFRWLGGPIELRDLTNVVAELTGIARTPIPAPETDARRIDPRNSPAEELVWKEYLSWLWVETGTLSQRQRRAFLLHSDLLPELEAAGVAPLRAQASSLNFSPNEFAEIWNRLPLDDLTIAQMIEGTRQQVINLRRVAREKLGAAWRKWNPGNKPRELSSKEGRA
jgi:hypothetical protein